MLNIDKDDILSAYKEKKWGKDEGGEHITHGYSLRGKHVFKKAVEGLKENMKKGVTNNVNGIEFKVLDTRMNGVGLEIEVEMVDNGDKGIAIVKI